MGRHSARDDDEPAVAPATSSVVGTSGRHGMADDGNDIDKDTGTTPLTERDIGAKTPAESGTRGDLRLLRERPALRARCAAAAIVPFLLYTAAMAVIGRADIYLLWVWIPTVTAGVAVGGFLDVEHRHDRQDSRE